MGTRSGGAGRRCWPGPVSSNRTQAAEELAALLDGLVYTALVRGPHDADALAAWLRPPLDRLVKGLPGLTNPAG